MRRIQLLHILLLFFLFCSGVLSADERAWLLIDTEKLTLEVKQDNKTLAVMENISIGRNGAGFKKRVGDDTTPIGTYKIGWINTKSRFYKFYGFNYPSVSNAKEALDKALLDSHTYDEIIRAHKRGQVPSQYTAIGGMIGIHGLGAGDKKIHELLNWTHGCIALTNRQIDQLSPWLNTGITVKVK
ncbi:MAG: L,D-transpeptidase [Methylococcales bacterium]|nr:L,D-transpeptidase [Methylococcales bacterium]